jgi:hypothetical protein
LWKLSELMYVKYFEWCLVYIKCSVIFLSFVTIMLHKGLKIEQLNLI